MKQSCFKLYSSSSVSHLKKFENCHQSMQDHQIMINNLTIIHNITQYYTILLFNKQYYTIPHNITKYYLSKSSCLHPSQASSSLSSWALLLFWKKHVRKLNLCFRKSKDCKGFLCFAKRKKIAVQLLVMQNSIYLIFAQKLVKTY